MLRALIACILALLYLTGCGESVSFGGGAHYPAYLPYVESTEVPASVTESEPIDVVLTLSTALDPVPLRGATHPVIGGGLGTWISSPVEQVLGTSTMRVHPWIAHPAREGDLAANYRFSVTYFTPGTQKLYIESADNRDNGGIEDTYIGSPTIIYPANQHAKWLEFQIDVLPKTS